MSVLFDICVCTARGREPSGGLANGVLDVVVLMRCGVVGPGRDNWQLGLDVNRVYIHI